MSMPRHFQPQAAGYLVDARWVQRQAAGVYRRNQLCSPLVIRCRGRPRAPPACKPGPAVLVGVGHHLLSRTAACPCSHGAGIGWPRPGRSIARLAHHRRVPCSVGQWDIASSIAFWRAYQGHQRQSRWFRGWSKGGARRPTWVTRGLSPARLSRPLGRSSARCGGSGPAARSKLTTFDCRAKECRSVAHGPPSAPPPLDRRAFHTGRGVTAHGALLHRAGRARPARG